MSGLSLILPGSVLVPAGCHRAIAPGAAASTPVPVSPRDLQSLRAKLQENPAIRRPQPVPQQHGAQSHGGEAGCPRAGLQIAPQPRFGMTLMGSGSPPWPLPRGRADGTVGHGPLWGRSLGGGALWGCPKFLGGLQPARDGMSWCFGALFGVSLGEKHPLPPYRPGAAPSASSSSCPAASSGTSRSRRAR